MRQQILQEHLDEALRLLEKAEGVLSDCMNHPGDVQLYHDVLDFLNLDHQQPLPKSETPKKG